MATMRLRIHELDAAGLLSLAREWRLQLQRDRDHVLDVRPPHSMEALIVRIRKDRALVRLEMDRERLGLPAAVSRPRSLPEAGAAILAALEWSPMTRGDLADALDLGVPELAATLRELASRGLVRQVPGTGLWVAVHDGL